MNPEIEGILANLEGHAGTHNPYIYSGDEAAAAEWFKGFSRVSAKVDAAYARGVENGRASELAAFPSFLSRPELADDGTPLNKPRLSYPPVPREVRKAAQEERRAKAAGRL